MSARYRLRRRLGRGGMAEVFEATAVGERGFERRVAVKRLLPEIGRVHDSGFLDEARIASHLHHANIVAVLDYGIADGRPFQVLELVDGIDLQSALALGDPLPPELVLHVCTEVAYALSHAHEARGPDGELLGIVHRDVKPANIMVSYDGDVKLGDFGIAFAHDRSQRTEVGIAKGTREFMAPEQWVAGSVDARSDLFALGCVVYALATGVSPMGRTRAEEMLEGQELKLDEPLPEDLAAIVARATRRQKRERYPTAAAMAEALGEALQKRVPQPPKALLQKWMRELKPLAEARPTEPVDAAVTLDAPAEVERPPAVASRPRRGWLVGAVAALMASGGGVAWWSHARLAPTHDRATRRDTSATIRDTSGSGSTPPVGAAPAQPPSPSAVPIVSTSSVAAVVKPKPHAHPTSAPRAPAALAVSRAPAEAAPAPVIATAHLLVGGERALRAEIWIDGSSRGFAPKLIELPAGAHEVELVLGDGSHLKKQIRLAASNTPSSPLRWIVP